MSYTGKFFQWKRTEEYISYLKHNAIEATLYKYGPPGMGEVRTWRLVGIINISKAGSVEVRGDGGKITARPGYELIVVEDTSFEPHFKILNIYERKEKTAATGIFGLGILGRMLSGEEEEEEE